MFDDEDTLSITPQTTLRDLVGEVPVLSGLPDELLLELQKAAKLIQIDPDSTILHQGEMNNNLYFLVLGTVDVYVDGGLVATLRRKGDLLGEMSVITSKPCSATIIAKTPVELICVNVDDFKKVTGDNQDQFEHILYRIYSKILTDKVVLTNQKAKRVEEMLEALQRAKNELQEINAQMERRVVERTQSIQVKLEELLNQHLKVLRDSLESASSEVDEGTQPTFKKSLIEVDSVINFLEPLVQRFNLEVSMKSKRVLLAQSQRKAQTLAKMALGGTGISIDSVLSSEEAKEKMISDRYDVVLVDCDTLDLVEVVHQLNPRPRLVYVASSGIKENLPKLLSLSHVPNIVFVRDEDRAGSIRTIMTTVTKLCSPNFFGLEKYLNVGIEIREMRVEKSADRSRLNDEMRSHFSNLGIRSSVLDSVSVVLEELLMNAIYDAPTDQDGNPLYNGLDRQVPVELRPHEQATLRFATDGTLLAVAVEDPFGALSAGVIMRYLDSCYGGREGSMQVNKGGAGRGLHQIIENSLFVVFNIQPRRRTEVIAYFDVVPGSKVERAPMLHYFVSD